MDLSCFVQVLVEITLLVLDRMFYPQVKVEGSS